MNQPSSLTNTRVIFLLTKIKQASVIEAFRNALSDLPKLLNVDNNQTKPLILIIDELDRCRPNFSLQLLERIKHFFSVPNVHFVLGTNLTQLENSIAALYGNGIDTPVYLQKFVHLTLFLVDTNTLQDRWVAPTFIKHLVKVFECDKS